MRRRLVGLVLVVHPFPVLVVVVSSALILVIVEGRMPAWNIFFCAIATVFLSQLAVGSLNDFIDRLDDALMQPEKPIPRGLVSPGEAYCLFGVAIAVLLPVSLTLGWKAAVFVWLGTGAGILYDAKLKRTPWSVVAYIVGFMSLFTWACIVSDRFPPWIALAYLLAPLLITAAHLAQSLPDVETDRELGLRGLAVVLGYTNTYRLVLFLYGVNAATAVVSSIIRRSPLATLLAGCSILLLIECVRVTRGANLDRKSRVRLFRLVAPGLALAALSSLLSVAAND